MVIEVTALVEESAEENHVDDVGAGGNAAPSSSSNDDEGADFDVTPPVSPVVDSGNTTPASEESRARLREAQQALNDRNNLRQVVTPMPPSKARPKLSGPKAKPAKAIMAGPPPQPAKARAAPVAGRGTVLADTGAPE